MAEIPILPVQINDLHKMLVEEIKMLNRNNIYDILIKINETANSVLDTTTEKHFKFIAYELVFLASRVIIESGVDINKASNLKNAYIKELKEIRISYVFVNWSNNMIHSFISLMYSNDNINSKCPIESAKKYISDNYYEDLTLTSIAKYIHLNPSYLSRCFKEKTGMNLIEYLTNYRIFKAKELLKTKQFTIDQISKKVGFKSNSYFTSVFKKNEKISPNDYRKKAFIENL